MDTCVPSYVLMFYAAGPPQESINFLYIYSFKYEIHTNLITFKNFVHAFKRMVCILYFFQRSMLASQKYYRICRRDFVKTNFPSQLCVRKNLKPSNHMKSKLILFQSFILQKIYFYKNKKYLIMQYILHTCNSKENVYEMCFCVLFFT